VTVSWTASSPVTRRGFTTTSWTQNDSPWSADMRIPHQRRSSRSSHQRVKRCALSFGIGKSWSSWVSWNPDKPSILTVTSQRWLSWRPEFPDSGQRRRQPFSCNTTMPGPIPVWRLWGTLQSLAGLPYHIHRIVRIWRLLTSISVGRWKMDYASNIFLTTTPSSQLWESGSPQLEQILSAACRLLFIAGENAYSVVVTMWNDSDLWLTTCSIQRHYHAPCICYTFRGNK
jgi:hypothetical protein